jgi:hypothetical protein
VEGEATGEPREAGHHLRAWGCGDEGELPCCDRDREREAEQQDQPSDHCTR